MKSRGKKMFAIMAMRSNWTKPKFVYTPGSGHLLIYDKRIWAQRHQEIMVSSGGALLTPNGKIYQVDWIIVPVWTETIL